MEPQLKHSPQRWWLAVLLVAGLISCYAHRGALSIAAPFLIRELNLSPAVMGILLSAFFWSYSFMQVPAGWLVDRFGVRRAYALGYTFWSAASAATGFAGSLSALIIVRMLLGVGQSVAFPASARAVANWFRDRERGAVTGGYLTGVRLGQALIAPVGAFLLAAYGWKFFFLITGIVPIVWVVPWMRFLRKWDTGGTATTSARGASFFESVALLKHRSVLGIFLGFFAYDYAWFLYVNWLPTYLVVERKFSTREMGIYSSVPYIVMMVVILFAGLLSDWLVRRGYAEIPVRKTLIAIGLAIGCAIVPAGMVEDKMAAVWLMIVSLCGLGICAPNCWALTQAVCSKNIVGTVSGIQNFGGNVGGALAPALTGFIAHATDSFALAMTLTGAILVGGIFSYWLLVSRRVDVATEAAPALQSPGPYERETRR